MARGFAVALAEFTEETEAHQALPFGKVREQSAVFVEADCFVE